MKTIPLTKGQLAIVDDEDYAELSQYKWHYSTGYAYRRGRASRGEDNKKCISMHRQLLSPPNGMDVDHINQVRSDNRRANLRIVTHRDNTLNARVCRGRSTYRGVSWEKRRKHWIANIVVNYKQLYLGSFKTEQEAALAYDEAAKKYFGTYAELKLNFPLE